MYKVRQPDIDGKPSTFVLEDYEGEAEELFLEADEEAGDIVRVIEVMDSKELDIITMWRNEWIS